MKRPKSKVLAVGFSVCRPSGTKDAVTVFAPDPITAGVANEAVAVKLAGCANRFFADMLSANRRIAARDRKLMTLPW